ncbi:MAG: signal peptidase I [Dehalococcoidales bacterium]|jgi:signal peptidase I
MKRLILLTIVIAVCVAGFFSIQGAMPFMPVFGVSMEPELKAGDLILISGVDPNEVEVGDIVVFSVPSAIREFYNYPPVVAHRVTEVRDLGSLGRGFRTKGDNTGGDPFTVRANDLLGVASTRIPYIGFILLFFQSDQGLMFLIISVVLFALFLYVEEINRGRTRLQRGIFAPVIEANRHIIEESRHGNELVAERVVSTEKKMDRMDQTLAKFASAIELYAEHLKSHTSAIQGLSAASQDLAKTTAEQEKLLGRLYTSMEEKPAPPPREKTAPAPDVAPKLTYRLPETIVSPSRMRFSPAPVVPLGRSRVAAHPPDVMAHTSPMLFTREVREEAPPAEQRSLPEPDKVLARTVKKELVIPGHWRNQRRPV